MNEKQNILQQKEELRSFCRTIGSLSGTLGSVVCRIYPLRKKNGRIVCQQRFAARPQHYKVNNRKDLVQIRSRFRTNNTFASHINKVPELKEFWKKYSSQKGYSSAYTAISKENSSFSGVSAPGLRNLILPPTKNPNHIIEDKLQLSGKTIKISDLPLGNFIAVVTLINPKSFSSTPFKLFTLKAEVKEKNTLEIPLPPGLAAELRNYKKFIIYSAIINGNKFINYTPIQRRIKHQKAFNDFKTYLSPQEADIYFLPLIERRKDYLSHSPPLAA
jgi:hypothetical protein